MYIKTSESVLDLNELILIRARINLIRTRINLIRARIYLILRDRFIIYCFFLLVPPFLPNIPSHYTTDNR
jgi:hypothetical protein